ncbi:MAG: phosphoribosyltransferase family protein [Gemmataceae bacterium]|nr:phosphoribosyltransferase family protein [Gemmataceae bacterium]MCI0740887.1 phosphoribosyltransferase family protein [Gemmataceae bacterium]
MNAHSEQRLIRLHAGALELTVHQAEIPLDELCAFGSRCNPKRGFLVISKVLGKHIPVRPSLMHHTHELLARAFVSAPGPALVVALAETAVGLGQGVFEEICRQSGRSDLLFLHSTRYRLERPAALSFREGHSHATEHLLYLPTEPRMQHIFETARTLILVDDEMTTGRTLEGLAVEYLHINPRLQAVLFACLTNWLSSARHAEIARRLGVGVEFHQLLEGSLSFVPDPAFEPGPTPNVTGRDDFKDAYLGVDSGRLGLCGPQTPDVDHLVHDADLGGGERVLVLGTGEFAHPPYLFARRLEDLGWDVHFQSTTRSPVLVGAGIASALEFIDNYHDGIPNYLYNVVDKKYDRVLICYETRPLPESHRLPQMLGATSLFF